MNTLYTAAIADRILAELAAHKSLHEICREEGMPHPDTVLNWVKQDREGFGARYREARQTGHGSAGYVNYTAEIADRFLGEIMTGRKMIAVCDDPGMPHHSTINRWVATDHEGFAARYRSARQVGRLTRAEVTYARDIADEVLDELMSGRTLEEICADPEMPSATTVRKWLRDNFDGFAGRYWQAREIGYQMIADEALRIVDDRRNDWIEWEREDGTTARTLDPQRVNRALARVSTRRWLLANVLPKKFGDRPDFYARRQGPDQGPNQAPSNDMTELMKLLDRRDRGLPGEDEPLDEQ